MAAILDSKLPGGLAAGLHELGISAREVLATAGLPARLLEGPAQRVTTPERFAVWRAIREVSGDPSIGIKLAGSIHAEATDPLFLAVMSAADVAGALAAVSAYKRVLSPETFTVGFDAAARRVTLTCEWVAAEEPPPQVLIDAELAFIVEICRRGTRRPELAPLQLQLRVPGLDVGAEHADFFGCPIALGASSNALVFDAEDAALPFMTFNPQLLGALLPYLRASAPAGPTSVRARVRALIVERLRGQRPDLRSVSKELAMSGRALQRQLKEEGTSFRQLLDDVRTEQAHGYLRSTPFSDGEVAFLLGFEDPSSFYRAFRSWSGMSPGQFRVRALTTTPAHSS